MSGGCFHVIAIAEVNDSANPDMKAYCWDDTYYFKRDMYIPSKNIVAVRMFNTAKDHCERTRVLKTPSSYDKAWYITHYVDVLFTSGIFGGDLKSLCTCGTAARFFRDDLDPVDPVKHRLDICNCDLKIFPLYEITVKNQFEVSSMTRKHGDDLLAITPTVTYLLDPAERDRMAKYLIGQDNPLHDFVEMLKYSPPNAILAEGGIEYQEANVDFDREKKRMRSE